jgi:predicted DCC family thiol-disulfide oxidoreductase YuxK
MSGPEIRVLYNDTCPVCAWEIRHYRRAAEGQADGGRMCFDPLDRAADWDLTPDQAARRLHVMQDGRILSGFDAFRAIWADLPRLRWLARLTGLPGVRPALALIYDRVAAPILYRAHLRRHVRAPRP